DLHAVHLDLDVPRAVQDVDALVRVVRVDEDLLVLLEPSVHRVPVEANQAAQLLDRRLRVVPGGVLDLAAAALDRELERLAPARRARRPAVRRQQLHAYVLAWKVIRGVVGNLPYKLEAPGVGDQLSTEVRTHPFGPVLDMDTLSSLRHCTLPFRYLTSATAHVWPT